MSEGGRALQDILKPPAQQVVVAGNLCIHDYSNPASPIYVLFPGSLIYNCIPLYVELRWPYYAFDLAVCCEMVGGFERQVMIGCDREVDVEALTCDYL